MIQASRNRSTVRQSIRHHRTRRPRRACQRFRQASAPVYPARIPASRNRSTVRRLSAVRPSAPDSGQYQRQPWRPFDRGEHRTPRHHRTRQGFRQRRASCHHRTRRACQPFDVATVRQSIRQAVANIERGNLSGDRAPVRAGTPQPFAACQRFNRATVANIERRAGFVATVRQSFRQAVANIERGKRAATVPACQSIRQAVAVRRAPPVSGSTVRAGFRRDRVPDSGNAATVRQLLPSNAPPVPASVRQSGEHRGQYQRQAVAVRRAPPVYPATPRPCASRKPWRFDVCRVPLPANVCRIPPAVRSTVARSPCNRGNRSTLARDVWPDSSPVHRKRPCKPSAAPPMSAPV